jgi:hypothetical protein
MTGANEKIAGLLFFRPYTEPLILDEHVRLFFTEVCPLHARTAVMARLT